MQKGVFWFVFLWGRLDFFFVSVFLFLSVRKSPQKAIFLQVRVSCLFWSPKRPVFKILLFFLCGFFLVFLLSSLSKFHFSLALSINPFLENVVFGCFFCLSFFVAFSFVNVCLFIWSKLPNIPFLKPKWLSFLVVYFSSVVFVSFSCFMYLSFCFFLVGFVLVCFFLFCFCFVFVLFLVLLSDFEKWFPCNSGVFYSCWLQGSCQFHVFVLVLRVLFVSI